MSKTGGTIYQVKITLDDVKPPIWRRVETRDCSLARLHDIIQISMGWSDGHLHVFEIGGEQYGLPEQWQEGGWGEPEVDDSSKLKLSQLAAGGIKKFRYVYDMGDRLATHDSDREDHRGRTRPTIHVASKATAPVPPKIAAGRGVMAISSRPSAIPSIRNTKKCRNGWRTSLIPRSLTWTGSIRT